MRNTAGWIMLDTLKKMMREAGARGAPVLRISEFAGRSHFKFLAFTVLSARTRDESTLKACARLFAKVNGPEELAAMDESEVAKLIYGVGFHRVKAKHLVEMAKVLVREFDGLVPDNFSKLVALPGVGRKTANVVLAHSFGKDTIGVDVHVHRISNRLGIVKTKRPEQTERELKSVLPTRLWKHINMAFVAHGQTVCLPKTPLCSQCVIRKYCKRVGVSKFA